MLENIIPALAENFVSMMPFRVIHEPYEMGVRWTMGRNPKAVGPGVALKIWGIHELDVSIVVDDVIELPFQSVITKDEKAVCFKVTIGYRIVDIVKHHCNVTDFVDSTKCIAMQHLAKKVREKTLEEVVEDLTKLERSLEGTLTTKFKDWGTEVFSVGFVDFLEAPTQLRLLGNEQITIPGIQEE